MNRQVNKRHPFRETFPVSDGNLAINRSVIAEVISQWKAGIMPFRQ